MKLVNRADNQKAQCRICEKIQTKYRRRTVEAERLSRWEREGGTLKASMERSRALLFELDKDIKRLLEERDNKRTKLS